MISAERFNKGILDMIETHSYEFYVVVRDLNIQCTCVTHATGQGDVKCHKCLGTGYKITIKKIKGAAQDTQLPPTFRSDKFLVARNYYIPSNEILKDDDLIVDNGSVFVVFEYQQMLGIKGTIPYRKISSTKRKFDAKIFFNNFNKIISRR